MAWSLQGEIRGFLSWIRGRDYRVDLFSVVIWLEVEKGEWKSRIQIQISQLVEFHVPSRFTGYFKSLPSSAALHNAFPTPSILAAFISLNKPSFGTQAASLVMS
jgi:hypothetical protein